MKVLIDEVKKVKITSSPLISQDTLSLDEIDLELGKEGIKELITDLMYKFKKQYEGELVEILQTADFEDIRDVLIVDEVKDLDTQIRLLKEELLDASTQVDNINNMLRCYEDPRD